MATGSHSVGVGVDGVFFLRSLVGHVPNEIILPICSFHFLSCSNQQIPLKASQVLILTVIIDNRLVAVGSVSVS